MVRESTSIDAYGDNIIRMLDQGISVSEMASNLDVTKGVVSGVISRMREKGMLPPADPSPSTAINNKLVEMCRNGKGRREMAKATGISLDTLSKRLYKLHNKRLIENVPAPLSGPRGGRVRPEKTRVAAQLPATICRGEGIPATGTKEISGCRYIYGDPALPDGDWRYCSRPQIDGTSWCEHHKAVVFKPRQDNDAESEQREA
jgi:hypothetical protein